MMVAWSNGLTPIATSTRHPQAMWVSGPASEMPIVHGRLIGCFDPYEV